MPKKSNFRNTVAFAVPALIILTALIMVFSRNREQAAEKNENNAALTETEPVSRSYPIMGTWAEVTLYGDRETVNKAMDNIYEVFKRVEDTCSRFNSESELSRLNASAAREPFVCSDLLWDVLQKCRYFYDLSDGAFDVTITPLMKLWGFYRKQNKIPNEQEIKKTLSFIGLNMVEFDSKNKSVFFKKSGIEIDLGGIAKGYAVDSAYDSIKGYDIKTGVINLAGNIRFFPFPPPGKKYYMAGVRDPFDKTKLMEGSLKLVNKSLATSGDYEQYVILDGKRFSHIINPKTGYPVKDMAATTVVSDSALWCDALSTSVFLNGEKFAEAVHKRFPGIDFLIVKGYHDKPESVKIIKIGKIWKDIQL